MNRHGIVVARDDGVRARCMGPGHCPECAKDMADATEQQQIDYFAKEFGRRWSMPNSELPQLIKWMMGAVIQGVRAYDEVPTGPQPLTLSIQLPETIKELQLLYCLSFIADHYATQLDPDEIARAAGWLASKCGVVR